MRSSCVLEQIWFWWDWTNGRDNWLHPAIAPSSMRYTYTIKIGNYFAFNNGRNVQGSYWLANLKGLVSTLDVSMLIDPDWMHISYTNLLIVSAFCQEPLTIWINPNPPAEVVLEWIAQLCGYEQEQTHNCTLHIIARIYYIPVLHSHYRLPLLCSHDLFCVLAVGC